MLTSKQRAYLRKLAHDFDPVFQIGKEGVTPEVVKAVDEVQALEDAGGGEHLKTCEDDLRLVADKVSKRTHSECVQMIGRRFVIYRAAKKPVIELPKP